MDTAVMSLKTMGLGGVPGDRAFGAVRPVADRGENAFNEIDRSHMVPLLGRDSVEGPERITILCQALDGPGALGTVLLFEGVEGAPWRHEVRRHPDLPQALLDFGHAGFRNLAKDVAGLLSQHPW
jgi:hypothetical protein